MKMRAPQDVIQVHVAYLPSPGNLGEMKTKPVQQSVRMLNSMGIQPEFVVGRSSLTMDDKRKERIALFCNVPKTHVIANPATSATLRLLEASVVTVDAIQLQQGDGQKVSTRSKRLW